MASDHAVPSHECFEEMNLAEEERTARLTILVDPRKKAFFEKLCAEEDSTPSQVLRRLMRRYIEERTGKPWSPAPAAVDPVRTRRGGA
jgi:hypothetical protein